MGVARILDWGGAQTWNHIGVDQKKESSQFDLGFVIGGGGVKFSWRPGLDWGGGGQTSSYRVGTKLTKQLN